MLYVPHEKLSIEWQPESEIFNLSLPWISMEVTVTNEDRLWVNEAISLFSSDPSNLNVQRFFRELKHYPIYYFQPRHLDEFTLESLQACPHIDINFATPREFIISFDCKASDSILRRLPHAWTWDRELILSKSQIPGSNLYDPLSFVSYLICYRQDWENDKWSGVDGFGKFLTKLLSKDEEQFFQVIGWIVKQSLYVTSEACEAMEPAIIHFNKAKTLLLQYISEEVGHHKFMEQVFDDLGLDHTKFPVGDATEWSIAALERTATLSPLAFSALLNLFEAAYYEGEDPISKIIRLSSKPHAAKGYDLHYRINEEHRHCDMPMQLAEFLSPQTHDHACLTLSLFELTLYLLDSMERNLAASFNV